MKIILKIVERYYIVYVINILFQIC